MAEKTGLEFSKFLDFREQVCQVCGEEFDGDEIYEVTATTYVVNPDNVACCINDTRKKYVCYRHFEQFVEPLMKD